MAADPPYDELETLERQAAEVAGAGEPACEQAAATLSAKRRGLLVELEHEGFLAEKPPEGLADAVREHRTLASYLDAAQKLWAYYRWDEREDVVEHGPPARLLDGVISVDWFRTPNERPSSYGELEWTAECEDSFRLIEGEGSSSRPIERHVDDGVYLLHCRYDDGKHKVMYTTKRWKKTQ